MQIKFSKKIKKVLSGFSISAFIVLMILIFGSTQNEIQGSTRNGAEAMENIFYDLFFKAATHSEKAEEEEDNTTHKRVSISDSLDQNIYIVDIDEASLTKLGNYNEWDRSIHAKVIKNLSEGGASAISFDILFKSADFGKQSVARLELVLHVLLGVRFDAHESLSGPKRGLVLIGQRLTICVRNIIACPHVMVLRIIVEMTVLVVVNIPAV